MAIYDINGNELASGNNGASPISGKRIALIGDSNTQYSGEQWKTEWDSAYGCNMVMLAKAGATWETTDGETATDSNGVGRVNSIIANADSYNLITEYDGIVFLLGTNCSNLGDVTSTDVSTMCGAVNYCLKKMCYYGRRIPIGIIIPFRSEGNYYNNSEMPQKFQYLKQIAEWYSVPTLNLWECGRIIGSNMTPDGTNHYTDGSVHLATSGNYHFIDQVGKWIAYQL